MVVIITRLRMANMLKKYFSFLYKDYRVLKWSFTVLTVYLLMYELYNCFVTKPTFQSVTQFPLGPRYFPDIVLCPRESFLLEELTLLGYEMSYYYTFGKLHNDSGLGWAGRHSQLNVSDVIDRISVIKSVSDCPELRAVFKDDEKIEEIQLEMNLTRVMYPNGRCCRAVTPDMSRKKIISEIFFKEYTNDSSRPNVTGFQMFLSDQMSASFFRPLKFNIDGEPLKSLRKKGGYVTFRVKIHEELHLEDDPHFPCRDYQYPGKWTDTLTRFLPRIGLDHLLLFSKKNDPTQT